MGYEYRQYPPYSFFRVKRVQILYAWAYCPWQPNILPLANRHTASGNCAYHPWGPSILPTAIVHTTPGNWTLLPWQQQMSNQHLGNLTYLPQQPLRAVKLESTALKNYIAFLTVLGSLYLFWLAPGSSSESI